MRPDELLIALAHTLEGFSALELVELLALAAEEVSRHDTCAGNYVARARLALLGMIADRSSPAEIC